MGISRSMVRPLFDGEDEGPHTWWMVEPIQDEDLGKSQAFFADLAVVEDGWTVGISGWVVVEFRTKKLLKGIHQENLESVYASWAGSAIYSFMRHEGTALISRTTGCGIDLPTGPPASRDSGGNVR